MGQTCNVPNTQSHVNPLDLHTIYQQQFQQQKAMFAKQQEQLKQQLEYQRRLEQQIAYQQHLLQQQHVPQQPQQIPLQQHSHTWSHIQPTEVSQQQLPHMTQQQHMVQQSQSNPQQVPHQIPQQVPRQKGPFCLRGANMPPPPSDTSSDSSDTEISEPSRHSSRHSKWSAHRHKRLEGKTIIQNPNEELLQQFKQLSKQVEALGVQKK